MATDGDFIDYIHEQAGFGARLTHKRMFGEYSLYLDGKVVAFACDNSLLLKPTEAGRALLPTLLDLVTSSPRPIRLLIETKHPTRYAGWVEEAVVDQLRRFGLAAPDREGPHPVSLMSFSELAIRRFRALAPGMPRVFLMDRVPLRMRTGELPFGARIAGPDVAILRAHPGYAARVHLAGGELFVWTVDDAEDVRLCRSLGVSAVITNRPADVLAALETPRPVHAAPTTGGDALGEATPHTV